MQPSLPNSIIISNPPRIATINFFPASIGPDLCYLFYQRNLLYGVVIKAVLARFFTKKAKNLKIFTFFGIFLFLCLHFYVYFHKLLVLH
jgi:hypothetical protein